MTGQRNWLKWGPIIINGCKVCKKGAASRIAHGRRAIFVDHHNIEYDSGFTFVPMFSFSTNYSRHSRKRKSKPNELVCRTMINYIYKNIKLYLFYLLSASTQEGNISKLRVSVCMSLPPIVV